MNNRYREEELNANETSNEVNEHPMNESKDEIVDELDENYLNSEKVSRKDKKLLKTIDELKNKISELEKNVASANDKYLKTLAESENYRKRMDEERIRDRKYASQRLLEKLVNSIDIFDKACNMKTDNEVLKNFLMGFQMIYNQINTTLEEEGVKKIKVDAIFDPRYHHAVETDYDETKEEGTILAVLKDGYMYKDRVLVAALVKVNKKPEIKCETSNNEEVSEKNMKIN